MTAPARELCMRLLLIIPLGLLAACDARSVAPTDAPATTFTVEGRVVDDRGDGLAGVSLRLIDTTRLSGHVDKRGCGTYYPERSVETDATGRFSASLPFQPTAVIAWGSTPWHHFSNAMHDVARGEPILLTVPFIPHHEVRGLVLDEDGHPIPEARIEAAGVRTDADGRFIAELPDDGPTETRVRRMGYRPLVVPFSEADRIVLPRRPMVTVTVVDPQTNEPRADAVMVSLWRGEERFSFCTAGNPDVTHEPAVGECSLDAEPGDVELRLENRLITTLQVTNAPMAVRVTGLPRPPPRTGGFAATNEEY